MLLRVVKKARTPTRLNQVALQRRRIEYWKTNMRAGRQEIVETQKFMQKENNRLRELLRLRARATKEVMHQRVDRKILSQIDRDIAGSEEILLQHQRTMRNAQDLIRSAYESLQGAGIKVSIRKKVA